MKRLQDMVAVITGASSGIGKETALLFLEHDKIAVIALFSVEVFLDITESIHSQTQKMFSLFQS